MKATRRDQRQPQAIGEVARCPMALCDKYRSAARVVASILAALTLQLGAGRQATADDEHMGEVEFEIACMPCHGVDGVGNGPRAKSLSRPPADLTQISKANHGIFPYRKVEEIIDGRADLAAHGAREMPVWGDRYRKITEPNDDAADIDRNARAQIRALVDYLATIQKK